MFSDHAMATARRSFVATAVAIVAGCGGSDGGSGTGIDDPVAVEPAKPAAGPLAADKPLAKAYDDAARAYSVSTDNPILKWQYRVWCQTGYRSPGDAGTGQVVDLPEDPTKDYLSPTGFNHAASLGKSVMTGGAKFMDNAWYFGTDYTGAVIVTLIATARAFASPRPALRSARRRWFCSPKPTRRGCLRATSRPAPSAGCVWASSDRCCSAGCRNGWSASGPAIRASMSRSASATRRSRSTHSCTTSSISASCIPGACHPNCRRSWYARTGSSAA